MREPDFTALRQRLEEQARPPAFDEIQARRRRRTTQWAVGTAVVVVVLVVAASASIGAVRHRAGPPGVVPSGTPSDGTVAALAFAPSGALFVVVRRACAADCAPDVRTVVLRSGDAGATWSTAGAYPLLLGGQLALLAADDKALWLVDNVTVGTTNDGGRTWQSSTFGGNGTGAPAYVGLAGGTGWFAQNGAVATATAGAEPHGLANQPPGHETLGGLAVFGPDRAVVRTGQDPVWYLTTDRGAHWSALADPCRGTAHPGAGSATMSGAPDGSLWAVCAGRPGAGQQEKQLVVSTDGGHTWAPRGSLESAGYGTQVVPLSGTAAWRTGTRADLYRTVDGTRWSTVARTGDAAGGGTVLFSALSADTAAYVQDSVLRVTRDGGGTWATRALPNG